MVNIWPTKALLSLYAANASRNSWHSSAPTGTARAESRISTAGRIASAAFPIARPRRVALVIGNERPWFNLLDAQIPAVRCKMPPEGLVVDRPIHSEPTGKVLSMKRPHDIHRGELLRFDFFDSGSQYVDAG